MYGYLKCFLPNMTRGEQNLLRRYYCSNCLAIKKNYGFFSTIILSYDLTIVPIILDIYDDTIKNHEKCHYHSKYGKLDSPYWKQIGALNLAIAEQKIIDSLEDDKSFFKRLAFKFIGLLIKGGVKKAKKDFPDLFEKAKEGMQKTIEVEKNNADVLTQGETFAKMIIDSIETITPLTKEKRNFIKGVSIWLCLMDAIDDLDKDIKKDVYNPLRYTEELNKSSKKELINSSYLEINNYIEKIKELLIDVKDTSQHEKINEALALYLNKIIPFQTNRVLTN